MKVSDQDAKQINIKTSWDIQVLRVWVDKYQILFAVTIFILLTPIVNAETITLSAKNQVLMDVMETIHNYSGAEVKLLPELANDVVLDSVSDESWLTAIKRLLDGYNYMVVWGDNGMPRQLTIYSRSAYSSGLTSSAVHVSKSVEYENLLSYQSRRGPIPKRLGNLSPGVVNQVSLPLERMKDMEIGKKLNLSLPNGQFEVVYEKQFVQNDGVITWVGYLEGVDDSYRIIINMNENHVTGKMVTPDGLYNIDTEEGVIWLVNAGEIS